MSELINNSNFRKEKLKELILKLHAGNDPQKVKQELRESLSNIPYGEVVEVEQELIAEGLPEEDILQLCDIHGEVLDGSIDQSGAMEIPIGHPVDVFIQENKALNEVVDKTYDLLNSLGQVSENEFKKHALALQGCFNELIDVDKHYQRKEYLLFPYLEKQGITGPPKVMWGKHDEIREHLKGCIEILRESDLTKNDLKESLDLVFLPVLKEVSEMVKKEEDILFPMAMDTLTVKDWWNIHQQTIEIGFTLYDPQTDWKPEGFENMTSETENTKGLNTGGNLQLPSGSFTPAELMAILNTVPLDMTFVDKNDKVKYFTQGNERIFTRSRSIINRDVRLCHPPGSVHIVEKILEDFKSGKEEKSSFWIQMRGKFILIEYYALRGENGEYLGTLEVSQDLTNARALEGERRILSYNKQ